MKIPQLPIFFKAPYAMIHTMARILILVSVFFLAAIVLSPLAVSAQADSAFVTCSGPDCQACHLVEMADNIIQFLIVVLTVVAALIFAYAGFVLVTSAGDVTAKESAKTMFTNVIIGYIIVLASWLIIDTGMKALLDDEIESSYGPWNKIDCVEQPGVESRAIIFNDDDWIDYGNGEFIHQRTGVPISPGAIQDNRAAGSGEDLEVGCDGETIEVKRCDDEQIRSVSLFGHSVRVHRSVVSSIERIDQEWRTRGGSSYYDVYSVGGYHCRNTASGGTSLHAYGLAVDINPNENPHCPTWPQCNGQNILITDMDEQSPPFYTLWTDEGWGWGGNWNSSKDAMHFSKGRHEGGDMCN